MRWGDSPQSAEKGKKDFFANYILFIPQGDWFSGLPGRTDSPHYPASYFTQIEVVGAAIGGARLGFNPGELLDFLLGWFGIDIYGDDIAMKKFREEQAKKLTQPSPQDKLDEKDKPAPLPAATNTPASPKN